MEYDKDILERTGIFVFNNAIPGELCKKIIEEYKKNKHLHEKGKTGGGYNPGVKNSIDWSIEAGEIDDKIMSILNIATQKIIDARPGLRKITFKYSGLQFQHSKKNIQG